MTEEKVNVVICDLYQSYCEVVKICFSNGIFVADPFHYTRYVLEVFDNIRIRLLDEYGMGSKKY